LAVDGDCRDYCAALAPDLVVLIADAGLGTINAVRLSAEDLAPLGIATVVVLNRFDAGADLQQRNLAWLRDRDGREVLTVPGGDAALMDLVLG
jgi:dethiobiotin synthetase